MRVQTALHLFSMRKKSVEAIFSQADVWPGSSGLLHCNSNTWIETALRSGTLSLYKNRSWYDNPTFGLKKKTIGPTESFVGVSCIDDFTARLSKHQRWQQPPRHFRLLPFFNSSMIQFFSMMDRSLSPYALSTDSRVVFFCQLFAALENTATKLPTSIIAPTGWGRSV